MAVPIDTSAPLLLPSQLVALVAAVEKADRDGEHNWIEWKRSLDLTAKTSHEHIAKHVLGFANRLVQTAALHMGGYGYILIGVEPGSILGVETIDPATLTDVIIGYVGTDGPGYDTEYVSVGDRTVLVVVINPPKHGDPVHTLRKNLGPHKLGQVLVRRTGKTDQAEPGEHRALVDRAKANQNTITIDARAVHSTVEGGPADLREQVEAAITAERELLMHPDRSTRPAPKPTRTSSWLAGAAPTPRSYGVPRVPLGQPTYEPDERTEDEYAEEVEKFLDRLRPRLAERIANYYWRRPGGMLMLAVDNLTPRNFAQVWVHVHIAGGVRTWPEELVEKIEYPSDFPSRPRRMGQEKRVPSPYERTLYPSIVPSPLYSSPSSFQSPGFTARDGGSVDIDFEPVHLHPHMPVELPPVPLLVDEPPGTELRLTWTATSESADGLARGEVSLIVVEPTPAGDLLSSDGGRDQ
ncbi:AlbA family DNA-binding domain-containing protein [Pseudonocardia sp.]|uniref:AlbA family DNA-binding domain-containing protein n=1 Tax=Pseudonocardia sp. TaxID=60912 RepID=UPI003D0A4F16